MSVAVSTRRGNVTSYANTALNGAATFWFVVAVTGQLVFATYVALFYGPATLRGDLPAWNRGMPHGYAPGDTIGNTVVGLHLLFAVIITVGGALQLLPQIRRYAPRFHRWNGRVYLFAAFTMSLGGLYMVWARGSVGDLSQYLGISLNAVLIMVCAGMALRYALARDFRTHRRWALRLFVVVSGVWFFRVGLMLSFVIYRAPFGFDPKTFTGPFLTFMSFAQYLVPLAVLELYLRTQDHPGAPRRFAMAAGLVVLTFAMGAGIAAATMIMWVPRLTR